MQVSITVAEAAFDLASEEAQLMAVADDAGAVVAFVGRVRCQDGPQPLVSLFLEHYPGVTENEIDRIAHEVATRWPLLACRVVHRIGHLIPGEGIVLVLVAARHRQAAFAAAECLMDYLKTQAPFWKRECFADGAQHWVAAKATDEMACQRWSAHHGVVL